MKINTNVLHNFPKDKYLAYIRSLPNFREEKFQSYATIILTLIAICLFGIFAIAPTLGTISQLKKTLSDDKFLADSLQTKITNMSQLQDQYNTLSPQLPILYAAIPKTPSTSVLSGKIRTLAANSRLTVLQLNISGVEVASSKKTASVLTPIGIVGTFQGNQDDFEAFTKNLVGIDRMITLDGVGTSRIKTQEGIIYQLNIRATAYYRP